MSTSPFLMKAGDRLPALQATLTDDSGPVNLTGMTVEFVMRKAPDDGVLSSGAVIFQRAATVLNPSGGIAAYEWEAGDTDTPGRYFGEFKAVTAGKTWSFPTAGFIPIIIKPSLSHPE